MSEAMMWAMGRVGGVSAARALGMRGVSCLENSSERCRPFLLLERALRGRGGRRRGRSLLRAEGARLAAGGVVLLGVEADAADFVVGRAVLDVGIPGGVTHDGAVIEDPGRWMERMAPPGSVVVTGGESRPSLGVADARGGTCVGAFCGHLCGRAAGLVRCAPSPGARRSSYLRGLSALVGVVAAKPKSFVSAPFLSALTSCTLSMHFAVLGC